MSPRLMHRFICTLCAFGIVAPASPAPAPPRPARADAPLEAVPQLAAKIDLEEVGTPVGDLLARLSGRCGVRLAAPDPSIADQKLIAYASGEKAGVLLDEIAELLGDRWALTRGPAPERRPEYRLQRGPAAMMQMTLYFREEQVRARAVWRGRFKRYVNMARLALGTVQHPPEEGPSTVLPGPIVMPDPGLVPLIGQLAPAQLELLFEQGALARNISVADGPRHSWGCARMVRAPALTLRLSQLPPDVRAGVVSTLHRYALETAGLPGSTGVSVYQTHAEDPDLVLYLANYTGDSIYLNTVSLRTPGAVTEFRIVQGSDTAACDPSLPINQGLSPDESAAVRQFAAAHAAFGASPLPNLPGKVAGLQPQEAREPLRPGLTKLLPGPGAVPELSLPAALLAVRQATRRTVLSDYFTKPQRLPVSGQPATLGELLAAISARFGRNIQVDREGVKCRSTTWPADELAEVPLRVLRPWMDARARLGYLPAEPWLAMGRLSIPQLCSLAAPSDLFGDALVEPARNALFGYDALRFYQALSPTQQAAAHSRPLTWRDLTEPQGAELTKLALLKEGLGVTPDDIRARFRLRLSVGPPARQPPPSQRWLICGLGITFSQYSATGANLPFPGEAERLGQRHATAGALR